MHRNTYIVILALAVLAALVVGLHIGKKFPQEEDTANKPATTPSVSHTHTPTPTALLSATRSADLHTASASGKTASGSAAPTMLTFTSNSCGVTFPYPDTWTTHLSPTNDNGVIFTEKANPSTMIILTCQKDIPTPALDDENIKSINIGTVSATLYHDKSSQDGTQIDGIIFTHPKTGLDVFIGGYGPVFNTISKSIKIL